MRNILFFLANLNDQDVDWFAGVGSRETVKRGDTVVHEGVPLSSLYLVLQGDLTVTVGDRTIAKIGGGEIVGEISFLDSRPPTATVRASRDTVVLNVPAERLRSRLRTDSGFASRFYLSVGIMLAHRYRDTLYTVTSGPDRNLDESAHEQGEFAPEMFDKVNLAASRFEDLLARVNA